jgi:catechol 2,3-dioxygenase-like lactoylglutathione lyase family enzyme
MQDMFDHVQIKVADLKSSRVFYEAVLKSLGYGVVFEIQEVVVGFGNNPHDMLEVRQADASAPVSSAAHIAFIAKNEDAVRNFHSTALEHGGIDNGAPGMRPHYEEGYYCAFVIDPNGHNLEAVFKAVM